MQNQVEPQMHAPASSNNARQHESRALTQAEALNCHGATARKPFIEPTVSAPADVLETTKFFAAAVGSGFIPI